MPLSKSSSKEAFAKNVGELISTWKRKKRIGTSKKLTKDEARQRALAIAFSMKRKAKG